MRKDDSTDSGSHRERGLKSTYGRRGSICAHFGWTLEYLEHGIEWAIVQRMLIDAPGYEYGEDKKVNEVELTDETVEDFMKSINS